MTDSLRSVYWVGSSKKDLLRMPDEVVDVFGFALHLAQSGKKQAQAKPLKGFGGAGVLEVWKTTKAIPTERFTPSDSPETYTSCIVFKRNPSTAYKLPSRTWT